MASVASAVSFLKQQDRLFDPARVEAIFAGHGHRWRDRELPPAETVGRDGGKGSGIIDNGCTSCAVAGVELNWTWSRPGPAPAAAVRYGYDAAGALTSEVRSNGVANEYVRDDLGRVTLETVTRDDPATPDVTERAPLAAYANTYAADGGKTLAVERVAGPGGGGVFSDRRVAYAYDGLNRLLSETVDRGGDGPGPGDFRDAYAYDLTANRLSKTHDAGADGVLTGPADESVAYSFAGPGGAPDPDDRLQSESSTLTGVTAYGYDANGSLTTRTSPAGTARYRYDLRNRLDRLDANGDGDSADPGDAAYSYDAAGNRVGRSVVGAGTTSSQVDRLSPTGYPQVVGEGTTGGPGAPTAVFSAVGLTPFAEADAAGVARHLSADPRGHTRQVLDAGGAVLAAYDHTAFGAPVDYDPAAALSNRLVADGRWDPATGFTRMGARDLMTRQGRWSTADPTAFGVGDLSDWNRYVFVGGNPNLRDPSGLFAAAVGLSPLNSLLLNLGVRIVGAGPALAATAAGGLAAYGIYSAITAMTAATDVATDWLTSGEPALVSAATVLASNGRAVADAMNNAVDKAIRAGRATRDQLLKFRVFPVIRSLMPDIYAFNVAALKMNPSWHVLNYLGPNSWQTDRNRDFVNLNYTGIIPAGYQLDEFPYASTVQGGRGTLFGPAEACPVPALQNRVQGGLLSAFYRYSLKGVFNTAFLVAPVDL